jgi:hypothetical protein
MRDYIPSCVNAATKAKFSDRAHCGCGLIAKSANARRQSGKECNKMRLVMKTLAVTVLMIVMLTGVASAQAKRESGENSNIAAEKHDAAANRAAEKRKEQMEIDRAYKAALDKQKAPETAPDPWAAVRPAPATKR